MKHLSIKHIKGVFRDAFFYFLEMVRRPLPIYCLVLLLGISQLLCAQENDSIHVLNPVVVSAKLEDDSLNQLDRQLHVVQALELDRLNIQTIEHILEHRPALDLRQRGSWDVQGDLHLRGATFNQNSVLIDGIPMNDPQTGHHNLNLPLENSDLESVEILYGGGSRVSGAGSFSGAVNFRTNLPKNKMGRVRFKGGAYGLLGGDIDLGGKNAKLGIHYLQSDGYIKNTDFQNLRIFAGKEWTTKSATIRITSGFQNKAFGAQNFYTTSFPYQFEETRAFYANGSYTLNKADLDLKVSWRRHWDRFELFRESDDYWTYQNGVFVDVNGDTASYWPGNAGYEYPEHNYHRTDVLYANLSKGFSTKYGRTTVALSQRYEGIVSNVLGSEKLTEPISLSGREGLSPGAYSVKESRSNTTLFGEHNFDLKRWSFSLGLIYNYNTSFKNGWYPGIDVGYRLNSNVRIFGSYNRSFRLPTFIELFYTIGGAQGSADLEQEISDNFELGGHFTSKWIRVSASVFMRQGKEMIDWVFENDTAWARNITEVDMMGVELSVDLLPKDEPAGLKLVRLGYTNCFSAQDELDIQSLYVLDYLRHKIFLYLDHEAAKNFQLHYQLSLQKKAGTYTNTNGITVSYKGFMLMDIGMRYDWKEVQLQLGAKNLFNASYVDRPNVIQPGIWIYGSVSYTFLK